MLRLFSLLVFLAFASAAIASAEIKISQPDPQSEIRINTNRLPGVGIEQLHINANQPSVGDGGQVRVSVNVNIFVPAPDDDSDRALKAQETGRKLIYELAGHECALLRDVLASECRLESVNVTIVRPNQFGNFGNQPRAEGFNINGNLAFRIVPK
jgi:hypothetical protein